MKKIISKEDQLIISYLNSINLRPSNSINQFWNELKYKYDKNIINQLEKLVKDRAEGITDNDFYDLKNKNIELSIDFTKYSADLYRKLFEWLVYREHEKPKRILDIGCDNGVVTCFIATLYPESEVFGIDMNQNGIECSQSLSKRLGLNNVKFNKIDYNNLLDLYPEDYFDMIISVRTMQEILDINNEFDYWIINEIIDRKCLNIDDKIDILNRLLKDDGEYIAFERLGSPDSVVIFIQRLMNSGLYVDWNESDRIKFHEVGDNEEFPLIIASKTKNNIQIIDGIMNLYKQMDITEIHINQEFKDFNAEIIFMKIDNKKLLKGYQVCFSNGSGKLRFELWKKEGMIITYIYSNKGYRNLKIISCDMEELALNELSRIVNSYNIEGNIVSRFENLLERENMREK